MDLQVLEPLSSLAWACCDMLYVPVHCRLFEQFRAQLTSIVRHDSLNRRKLSRAPRALHSFSNPLASAQVKDAVNVPSLPTRQL